METYQYDRENAEKAFEYMKYKRANYTLGKSLAATKEPKMNHSYDANYL
jgi:hypothetical protein